MDTAMFNKLKRALTISAADCNCCGCPLSDDTLSTLLEMYPCYELALYHACLLLSRDSSLRLSDGTQAASQSRYWLRLALSYRPCASTTLRRADERGAYVQ